MECEMGRLDKLEMECPRKQNRSRRPKTKHAPSRGESSTNYLSGRSRRPLENLLQNQLKHRFRDVAAVIPESVFVQVGLQEFLAHHVVSSADSALDQAPESLNGVGVNVAHH